MDNAELLSIFLSDEIEIIRSSSWTPRDAAFFYPSRKKYVCIISKDRQELFCRSKEEYEYKYFQNTVLYECIKTIPNRTLEDYEQ